MAVSTAIAFQPTFLDPSKIEGKSSKVGLCCVVYSAGRGILPAIGDKNSSFGTKDQEK